jgi:hypothetical protein
MWAIQKTSPVKFSQEHMTDFIHHIVKKVFRRLERGGAVRESLRNRAREELGQHLRNLDRSSQVIPTSSAPADSSDDEDALDDDFVAPVAMSSE